MFGDQVIVLADDVINSGCIVSLNLGRVDCRVYLRKIYPPIYILGRVTAGVYLREFYPPIYILGRVERTV